ncbi:MAG: hypothetical protein HY400_01590 [Elusimicrobia bacterium]|nr:hypothetical protein [Elusimicrobiota bacterium]
MQRRIGFLTLSAVLWYAVSPVWAQRRVQSPELRVLSLPNLTFNSHLPTLNSQLLTLNSAPTFPAAPTLRLLQHLKTIFQQPRQKLTEANVQPTAQKLTNFFDRAQVSPIGNPISAFSNPGTSRFLQDDVGSPGSNISNNTPPPENPTSQPRVYPRLILLFDVFEKPIGDAMARYLETLVKNLGVHVVIISDRPESGKDSIQEVFLDKLEPHTTNPITFVSYNGAKIFAYNSRANHHRSTVPDTNFFNDKEIENFRKINDQIVKRFRLSRPLQDFGSPSLEKPFTYGASIPELRKGITPQGLLRAYNRALHESRLPYKMELEFREGKPVLVTHSTALKHSLNRIREAVRKQMDGEDLIASHPKEVLVLADPGWFATFQRSLPKDVIYTGIKSGPEAEKTLGAIFSEYTLNPIYVDRYKLVSYVRYRSWQDFLLKSLEVGEERRESAGGGSGGRPGSVQNKLAMFKAAVNRAFQDIFWQAVQDGTWERVTLQNCEYIIRELWYKHKVKMGDRPPKEIRLDPGMMKAMNTPEWKKLSRGVLESELAWLRNFFQIRFPRFPQEFKYYMMVMERIGSNPKSLATTTFTSKLTGRKYSMGAKPLLSELRYDIDGIVLIGQISRTGKHAPEPDILDAKLTALALIRGDGVERIDDKYFINGIELKAVRIEFNYHRRIISRIFKVGELDDIENEVTSLIEKMENDEEFQKYYAQQMSFGEKKEGKPNHKKKKVGSKKA